ncbi:MAG: hypothetical protein JKX84_03535, partial [Flavobacteriales bacterium]|nr:hypothetical protein [Flavobacteriales bacterium]
MKKVTLSFIILVSAQTAFSQCLPPSAFATLDVNNVRMRMNNGGSYWWDLQGVPRYEIPKGSGKHSFFAGAFWIGGLDQNDELHLA